MRTSCESLTPPSPSYTRLPIRTELGVVLRAVSGTSSVPPHVGAKIRSVYMQSDKQGGCGPFRFCLNLCMNRRIDRPVWSTSAVSYFRRAHKVAHSVVRCAIVATVIRGPLLPQVRQRRGAQECQHVGKGATIVSFFLPFVVDRTKGARQASGVRSSREVCEPGGSIKAVCLSAFCAHRRAGERHVMRVALDKLCFRSRPFLRLHPEWLSCCFPFAYPTNGRDTARRQGAWLPPRVVRSLVLASSLYFCRHKRLQPPAAKQASGKQGSTRLVRPPTPLHPSTTLAFASPPE